MALNTIISVALLFGGSHDWDPKQNMHNEIIVYRIMDSNVTLKIPTWTISITTCMSHTCLGTRGPRHCTRAYKWLWQAIPTPFSQHIIINGQPFRISKQQPHRTHAASLLQSSKTNSKLCGDNQIDSYNGLFLVRWFKRWTIQNGT